MVLDDKDVAKIKELSKEGLNNTEIADKLGITRQTVGKYLGEEEKEESPPMATPVNDQTQNVTLREAKEAQPQPQSIYKEMPEPYEWLKDFLESYNVKPAFIRAQCARVERRNQLPSPSDLMVDMKEGDSGQKNLLMIRDIIEDYDYAVEDYLKKREKLMMMPYARRHGIPVRDPMMPQRIDSRGIPIRDPYYQEYDYYRDQHGGGRRDPHYDGRQGIPVSPPQYYQPPPYQHLESELDRFLKINQLIGGTQEKNPMISRLEQENNQLAERLNQLEEERKRSLEGENLQLKQQINQLAERRSMLEDKIRQLEMMATQKSISETDLKYKELEDRHKLEVMKLNEGSKTRDTIASAVKTGFSQIGTAIARTAMEAGSGDQQQMQGFTDGKNMWQAECPYCNTLITAPLSAKMIQCPGCNRRLEVGPPEEQITQPQRPERRQLPPQQQLPYQPETTPEPSTSASFTVEQEIPEEEEPPVRYPTAACPHCGAKMTIPPDAKIVQCPKCSRRLEVNISHSGVKPIEQEKPREKPIEEEIPEPEKKYEEIPLPKEPSEKPPDWREQKKVPKQTSTSPIDQRQEEFTPEEKEKIDKSLQEAKEGKIKPIEKEEIKKKEPKPKSKKEKDFVCPECGKSFDKQNQLRGHMLHHKREKKKGKK